MNRRELDLTGVILFEPILYPDERGVFAEIWNDRRYDLEAAFVQDNLSRSARGVLRGLHFQNPSPQGKLITVMEGEVFDVAVDLRTQSPTFGQWVGVTLSSETLRQLYIPSGFAHGFQVTSLHATVHYKCTALYDKASEKGIRWDDPDLAIEWPLPEPVVSPKDAALPALSALPLHILF